MNVQIKNIGDPSTKTLRGDARQSQFLVDFDSEACSGKAHLFILHSSPSIDMAAVRKQFVGKSLKVNVSVEAICDFKQLSGCGREQVVSLGPTGSFALEGFISKHLISDEGSVFQADGIELIITPKMAPATFDRIEEGAWVSFSTKGLSFWVW